MIIYGKQMIRPLSDIMGYMQRKIRALILVIFILNKVHFPTTNLRIMQVYSLHITRPLRISKKVLSSHQMGRNLSPLFLDKKKLRKASYYIVHTYDMLFSSHYVPLGPRAYTGFMSCMWFFVLIFWQHIPKK